jgi:hypothetical protein
MDKLTYEDLQDLVQVSGFPCISIYMPAVRAGAETQQNHIRYKNLLRQAEDRLQQQGLRKPEITDLFEPAWNLVQDSHYWNNQAAGLALFLSPGVFRHFRLPLAFGEEVAVNNRFQVKQLFPVLANEGNYYLLALSQKDIRLMEGDRYAIREIDLDTLPASMSDALRFDDHEPQVQIRYNRGSGGKSDPMYHGHSEDHDSLKDRLVSYFHKVDEALQDYLAGKRAPLVLAGVEYLIPIYRQASSYDFIAEQAIPGNPEMLRREELHQQAWPIVEPLFSSEQADAVELFHIWAPHGKASGDLEEIIQAAYYGRIERLFVSSEARQWGKFDPETGALELAAPGSVTGGAQIPDTGAGSVDEVTAEHVETGGSPGRGFEDLYDLAVVHTFINRGQVFVVPANQVPGGGSIAAVYRYG